MPRVTGFADSKPKLLDLYCGGGGASFGYELAGWDVVGVDIDPQPKYRGKFVQADAPLLEPILLCGAMFGIITYRHRLFESNIEIKQPEHPKHIAPNAKMGRKPMHNEHIQYMGHLSGVKIVQDFTGLHWLGQKELAQSIPPQYTEWVGKQLLKALPEHCR